MLDFTSRSQIAVWHACTSRPGPAHDGIASSLPRDVGMGLAPLAGVGAVSVASLPCRDGSFHGNPPESIMYIPRNLLVASMNPLTSTTVRL